MKNLSVRTRHVLSHAGRINVSVLYSIIKPEDCPPITRMLAIHVLSEEDWCAFRNGGKISYKNLISEV